MKPKSLPVILTSSAAVFIGTLLVVLGIGIPQWVEISFPIKQEMGLFQVCVEGRGCRDRDDIPDHLRLVTATSCGGFVAGLLASLTTVAMLVLFFRRKSHSRSVAWLGQLQWLLALWSLVAGAAIFASLMIFRMKEFDTSAKYASVGISFVLTAAGGGIVVVAGLFFAVCSQRLLVYAKRTDDQVLQEDGKSQSFQTGARNVVLPTVSASQL